MRSVRTTLPLRPRLVTSSMVVVVSLMVSGSSKGLGPWARALGLSVLEGRERLIGYLVQVSSQKSEADARASFRALQSKFPNGLGFKSPGIKRTDLGEKGVYYRVMVGPFGSPDEASQF